MNECVRECVCEWCEWCGVNGVRVRDECNFFISKIYEQRFDALRGKAKSKRETFAQCNILFRFGTVRFRLVLGLVWFAMVKLVWLGFFRIVSAASSEHFNRL